MKEDNYYWIRKLSFQKILLAELPKLTSEYCNKEAEEIIVNRLVKEIKEKNLVKEDKLN